jgi:hypothetical protein
MPEKSRGSEVTPEEFRGEWEQPFRRVFQLPDAVPDSKHEDWPLFPDQIFWQEYELAFLDTDLLLLSSTWFDKLQQFLRDVGETEFAILLTPYPGNSGLICHSFPVGVDWDTFQSVPVNIASSDVSLSTVSTSFMYFIVGRTGRWGMYFVMQWDALIVGYVDTAILEALQSAFDIDGRNVELAEEIGEFIEGANKSHYDELSIRQAHRFREIAEQIRAEDHASEGG